MWVFRSRKNEKYFGSPAIRHVYGTNWLDIERTRSATPCVSTHFARERAKYHFALRSERPHSALRKRQSVSRVTVCFRLLIDRSRAKYHFALRSERPHSAPRKHQSVRQPPCGLLTVAREYRRFGSRKEKGRTKGPCNARSFCGELVRH